VTPAGQQAGGTDTLDYMRPEFAELKALVGGLLREEAGAAVPAEGGPTSVLLELPALLGHILSRYQDLYAGEAFLATARSAKSLVRHARRLAYAPDAGMAASGPIVLTVGPGLFGRLPEGFAFASTPLGDQKAATYETLDPLDVDARWNDIRPVAAALPTEIGFQGAEATLPLAGLGLGLEPGEPVLLAGQGVALGCRVLEATEDPAHGETAVRLATIAPPGQLPASDPAAGGYTLFAKPALEQRVFGHDADPTRFPAENLANPHPYDASVVDVGGNPSPAAGTVELGYEVQSEGPGLAQELYLSSSLDEPIVGQTVLVATGPALLPFVVTSAAAASVTFRRGEVVAFDVPDITTDDGNLQVGTKTEKRTIESHVAGTVTALALSDPAGNPMVWSIQTAYPVRGRVLGRWRQAHPVAATRPNPAPAGQGLVLAADLDGMRPGRSIVLASLDESRVHPAIVSRFELQQDGTSRLWWDPDLAAAPVWPLGDLKVLGNVASVSHGERAEEVLGGSDGVSPFQRFALKKHPVTHVPGGAGGEPELEVRVDNIAWRRVEDFHGAGPNDRVYRVEQDETHASSVVFGGRGQGAVPPAGRKNITASYRFGLGTDGNVGSRRVSRIKKAVPILQSAVNPAPLAGGAAPADADAIRVEATRYIRTFDRAVSVQDFADLVLLFPGIVRSAAHWIEGTGVHLVVATADGDAPPALAAVRAFLDARRDVTVPLRLVDPMPVDVTLAAALNADPSFLTETVRNAALAALVEGDPPTGLFAFRRRGFGEAVPLSAVYAALHRVPGVSAVRVTRFDIAGGAAVRDTIQASQRQWLRLRPQDCDLAVAPGGA
jgi:hypothetical protein